MHTLPDAPAWAAVSRAAGVVDQRRVTKYMLPTQDNAAPALPLTWLNVNAYALHYDLLVDGFPELFPGLTRADYAAMILRPERRTYHSGNLALYIGEQGDFFGFTAWDDPTDPTSTLSLNEVTWIWQELSASFGLGPLTFVPNSSRQRAAAEGWDAPFPIENVGASIAYEAYNQGVGFGTVRRLSLVELAAATDAATFGHQDLLVLDEAPFDVERPIAGAVTGSRQGELSHLNVRSAARGTPNCFVREPRTAFAAWEGRLVRLECGADTYSVRAATAAEAEAWWASIRPAPVTIPSPNLEDDGLVPLLALPTGTAGERAAGVARFGAKGANLAILYQRVPAAWQLEGFLIPFAWYDRFLREGTWTVDLGDGPGPHSFADTLAAWHVDPAFLADGGERRARLAALRDAMEEAPIDPALHAQITDAIREVFGADDVMVRFRSSSNAEDAAAFSGAGLYTSESVCLADDLDADEAGPSRCDPDQPKERSVARGLRKVWASTWNVAAWEERAWYGIDSGQVAMGVLVNTRSKDEAATIVAFTGNPGAADDRYLVNAQIEPWEVVDTTPGVWPERSLLTLTEGAVTRIERVAPSSQAAVVLDDARLRELGAALWQVEAALPVDEPAPVGSTRLLDTEWKVLDDGRLIIKQWRPFLRGDAAE